MLTKSGAKLLDFGLAKLRVRRRRISMSGMTPLATTRQARRGHDPRHTALHGARAGGRARGRRARRHLGARRGHLRDGHRHAAVQRRLTRSVIGAILKDDPPPISSRQPLAPAALDHVVTRCLAKDPDDRWQSAAESASSSNGSGSLRVGPAASGPARQHRSRLIWSGTIGSGDSPCRRCCRLDDARVLDDCR